MEEMNVHEVREGNYGIITDSSQHQNDGSNCEGITVIGQSQLNMVDTEDSKSSKGCLEARRTLGILGLLGIAMMYSIRFNLSVAIVSMVKSEPKNLANTTDLSQVCLPPDVSNPSEKLNERGEFAWDKATQGNILGAFSYGYILTNFLGGRAAEYFGGKLIFGWGIVLTGIFSVLSPFCARVSSDLFIATRVLEGVFSQTLSAWRAVFLISSAVYLIAGTIYIVLISAEIQQWNFPKVKRNDKTDEKE